ncbi:MAG: MerR family transcriptional regulator [Deltaproteobacteria bacterium]|nr:MAG: MerR family transcriptional regulator [Deltaproteobacteria bacterium]
MSRRRSSRRKDAAVEVDLGTDKLYFRIGEVARIVGVAPHVLRYWESEFPMVRPDKGRNQQRIYRRRDVETLLRIKHLLYERRFTIEGARRELRGNPQACPPAAPAAAFLAGKSLDRVEAALDDLERALVEADRPELADPAAYLLARTGASTAPRCAAAEQPLLARPPRS